MAPFVPREVLLLIVLRPSYWPRSSINEAPAVFGEGPPCPPQPAMTFTDIKDQEKNRGLHCSTENSVEASGKSSNN